jgi:hypothetical protein
MVLSCGVLSLFQPTIIDERRVCTGDFSRRMFNWLGLLEYMLRPKLPIHTALSMKPLGNNPLT